MNMVASIIGTLSGSDLWEIRRTISAVPDSVMDTPDYTTIKIKTTGLFSYINNQNHRIMGIAEDADAVLSSTELFSLDSMIENDNVQYEIITNASACGFWYPAMYTYSLRRVGNLP